MVKAESDPLNVIPRRLSESDLFVKSKFVGLIYILPFLSLGWVLVVTILVLLGYSTTFCSWQ